MVIILHRSARASRRKTGRRSHVSAAGACGRHGSSSAVEGELRREKHLTSSLPALNHSSPPPGAAGFPGRIRVRVRSRRPHCCCCCGSWSPYSPAAVTSSNRAGPLFSLGHFSKQLHVRVRCEVHRQLLSAKLMTCSSILE